MPILELRNIDKVYTSKNSGKSYALNNFSYIFPSSGLIAIFGKSGSGKSTLLNMIAGFDTPTNGKIYFNNEDISKWKENKKSQYLNKYIGMVFQHYHLLEDFDVLYNVMLPSLISGNKEKYAKEDAITLLKGINFDEKLYSKKVSTLSGGEKQRVAILRAFINNPKIVLADEPTGALDSKNSKLIMEILKNASRNKLVIIVSHNKKLVSEYADRIIELKDGKIVNNKVNKEENNGVPIIKEGKSRKKNSWINKIFKFNFFRRRKRNLLSIISLIVGLTSSFLIVGFSNGSPNSLKRESYNHLDYGSLTLDKELTSQIGTTGVSLVQTLRPSKEEIDSLKPYLSNYHVCLNYDYLFPSSMDLLYGENKLESVYLSPIYSFCVDCYDTSLLYKGIFPTDDDLHHVVVNKKAYEQIKDEIKVDPLNIELSLTYETSYNKVMDEYDSSVISDYFSFESTIKIVGVVNELDFLSTPKIYYSYVGLEDYLSNSPMNNLSQFMEEEITWDQIINESDANESITSYSYRLFLKDINKKEDIEQDISRINSPFVLSSTSLTIYSALSGLFEAATMGMDIFLILILAGTVLILGIVSLSSYLEDKKTSAILSALGALKDDILEIYLDESVLIGIISLIFSLLLSPLLSLLINKILEITIGFSSIISIPFSSFLGVKLLLPAIVFIGTIFASILSTFIPISFSKKISIKEELKEE